VIAPLRARHRVIFAVLAIALPVIFVLALRARDDERNIAALPETIASDGPDLGERGNTYVTVHNGEEFRFAFDSTPRLVAVEQVSGERAPDLLVYWTPSAPQMHELPSGSILLGALGERERRFVLPDAVNEHTGAFVVFALAHGAVIAVVNLNGVR
jgi:hypothetical protein